MQEDQPLRYVKFKITSYDLNNGNVLTIIPIPHYMEDGFNVEMGIEKFQIETQGDLDTKNIQYSSLNNFSTFLSNYLPTLKQLT